MKYIHYLIFILLWSSCISLKTVPVVDQLPIHVKGSTVKINRIGKSSVTGELIAINEDEIIYLIEKPPKHIVTSIHKNLVKSITVILSRASNNRNINSRESKLIPLMSLGHGWWGVFTLPINVAVVFLANRKKYQIKLNSSEELSKFARFPQGMPEGISLNDLITK